MTAARRLVLLFVVVLALNLQPAWIPPAASQSAAPDSQSSTQTQTPALEAAPPGEPVAPEAPAPEAALAEAISKGKWPAQVAASSGAIRPDVHGPQRTDPAEGIPAHAYSPFDERRNREYPCPPGGCEYVEGQVLVKLAPDVATRKDADHRTRIADRALTAALSTQNIADLEPIFPGAQPPMARAMAVAPDGEAVPMPDLTRWYRAKLSDPSADVEAAVESLSRIPGIALAEPDYLRKPVGDERRTTNDETRTPESQLSSLVLRPSSASTFNDPLYAQQWHLAATNVPQAWQWLSDHGLPPGGNRDIVVAVIDTGVDLSHPDLAANLWTNSREIAGNGVDDDGNSFVDDVHGANVVSNQHSGNPLDDHGHGTHVAGIIAAQAGNGIGGVGVAYNTQIMAIKAAQYSGVLATSDIAEGIYYAVAQGADVINMSFGGYARSQVEDDALAVAFGQAVLVAAAGNDGKPNLPCEGGRDMYPAAYNWVLGVMARQQNPDAQGDYLAGFSNYDCAAQDTHEYELMAPGVDVWSTLPNGQYAAWDGTSMAAPVVSGIAALLRTKWSDKDHYSSRFIMGQIATTGGTMQAYTPGGGTPVSFHVPNSLTGLTSAPHPSLSYLNHWLFDTTAQAAGNDDDGIIDAGETVDLAIVIRNQWGKADPVNVTLEAWAEGAVQPDPYITMINGTVDYGAVGSFNIDDNGLTYDNQGVIVGVQHPFRFTVDPNTPNDHVIAFRLTMTAGNGYDPADPNAPYIFVSRFYLIVQRGRELPRIISEDMTLTKDNYWLIPDATLIEAGVHVAIMEGTQVQFWSAPPGDPYYTNPNSYLQVEGHLNIQGSATAPVELFTGASYPAKTVNLSAQGAGEITLSYIKVIHPCISGAQTIEHGYFKKSYDRLYHYAECGNAASGRAVAASSVSRSVFSTMGQIDTEGSPEITAFQVRNVAVSNLYDRSWSFVSTTRAENNVFLLTYPERDYLSSWADWTNWSSTGLTAGSFKNNAMLNRLWQPNASGWLTFWGSIGNRAAILPIEENYWTTASTRLIDLAIYDYNDNFNCGVVQYQPFLATPPVTAFPFVVDVRLSTSTNPDVSAVGSESVTFTITFNRDMSTSNQPQVSFGPAIPFTDYMVNGDWINARTWQGTFNITPVTGDGYQLIRVAGAVAADDPWLVTGDDAGRFRFEIITSGTESMNLQATGGEGRVNLTWTQNDFDLLAGFNLYRSTSQDGTYSRINTSIIPPDTRDFTDTNVTPGIPYYYKFTVVKSDITESDFSNVAQGTPLDTIPPVLAHTPVTTAAPGLALTLAADATDNVAVQGVTLYFRAIGGTAYTARAMTHTTGNRHSATLEGSRITSPGIEYYIEATDGISTVQSGRPEYPHQVAVTDKPTVTAVTPNRGPADGGTATTIAGSNFKPGATVTFGSAAAEGVTVVSSSQITCMAPAHYPAAVDVVVTNPGGATGSLTRGFTFESTTASLSLPATGGEQHAIVQIPINAANVQGLAAADIKVTFDPAVLSARGAHTGSLTPGWSLTPNSATAGEIRLAMASPGGTVTGAGTLALLEFEVVGAAGSNSPLTLASAALNAGAIPVDLAHGSFSVANAYSIAGTIRFWQDSSPVPGVQLTLAGPRLYTGLSAANGAYSLTGVPAGDYALTPAKADDVRGITAYDASLALQYAAGLITLTGAAFTAGDVDKDLAITSMDAFYILQKSVDLIALPFPGAGVVWGFTPANRTFTGLNSNRSGQDFTAVLLGDISGNWASGGGALAAGLQADATASLSLSEAIIPPGAEVTLNLKLAGGVADARGLDLAVSYDSAVVQFVRAERGDLSGNWSLAHNAQPAGAVRIGLAGSGSVSESATLARLTFRAVGAKGQSSALTFGTGLVNEGGIAVTTQAGHITVDTPPVTDLKCLKTEGAAKLTWTHVGSDVQHYEVWRAENNPYFVPGQNGIKIADNISPGTTSFTDTDGGLGNSTANSYYAVVGVDADGRPSPVIMRVGEFDFSLTPGSGQ